MKPQRSVAAEHEQPYLWTADQINWFFETGQPLEYPAEVR
jgi:hypothetical protein